ncbi:outer membrane efflux protein : Outer membrane protein OS=Singulisphaera acidiphila (strain ATCC BAA-1392 / DSM 18658 / VKM B-2454 / MOB10) GN=Sinac_3088 PE=4 SV=1: OEP [Tuwongella immobilis]|uniref:Transporter n=2 Tax=Tuwongella immobilis TaxID=692036 RepID=A0A6C2YK23_9BACT|nr:outer membrane efflux protein : Outer membrane protein OS=Singulisphaera acidiphila (strain ATCC BAA-1392 / DSM 18658 / VKM B-2454 / MOB10) GN=Sinac_3088 PE=4 SV=1: OEP [Tuwongella immobilis]VTR99269.1 outer membrane efflux protein : Outer membrane protein OS=Singulisphaera acidiphila (strain ATCC BAA-1392 / DSM 18658 / VKM B-2454 / MOB10) GN=Sinac_3088 PE=4 SV=1: OEP [Tuwongella immobilis]
MRGKIRLIGLLLLFSSLVGCKQRLFLDAGDYQGAMKIGLPRDFENDTTAGNSPLRQGGGGTPATVLDPSRPIRYISLQESIARAMENGSTGSAVGLGRGLGANLVVNDTLVSFTGQGVAGDDSIRAFSLDPAISGANIERALSKFDARWVTSMSWTYRDDALANSFQSLQNGDNAAFSSGVFKPLPTGGLAGITFSTEYSKLSQPPANFNVVNPSYRPRMALSFEQPLLQGYGIAINQLLPSHPGSIQQNLRPSGGQGVEGILVTRLRAEQSKSEFERNLNILVLNVELAYWSLYGAYFTLYAREQALRQAFISFQFNKTRFDAGRIPVQELAQTRAQLEQFRAQRITSLGSVLEAERQLRGVIGLAVEDGTRLVPSDSPSMAPFTPDWEVSVREALTLRPELVMARQELKVRQLDVQLQKNSMLPDVRLTSSYDINAIGTQLDGSGPANALANFRDNRNNTWSLGIRADIPLGFRDANANLRISRLNLARSFATLQNQELKAERFLQQQFRQLFEFYEQARALRAQREALAEQLRSQFTTYRAGKSTLDVLLEAQRFYSDALSGEYNAIVSYNNALATFQYAKGTILDYNNIVIGDGPLPEAVLTRAVEHQEQRTRALVLRTREMSPSQASMEQNRLPVLYANTPPLSPEAINSDLNDNRIKPLDPLTPFGSPTAPSGAPLPGNAPAPAAPMTPTPMTPAPAPAPTGSPQTLPNITSLPVGQPGGPILGTPTSSTPDLVIPNP